MEFKDIMRNKRAELGFSQYKLAELIGVTQPFINHIEKGSKKPSFDVLLRICEVLEIPLFGETIKDGGPLTDDEATQSSTEKLIR